MTAIVIAFACGGLWGLHCGYEYGPCDTLAPSQIPREHYKVARSHTTGLGVAVDLSGHDELWPEIGAQIDSEIVELYQCLREQGLMGRRIAPSEVPGAWCYNDPIVIRDEMSCRGCLEIKVPRKWESSCIDASIQLLPVSAPDWHCIAKGLTPTPECPCRWRAGIQDGNILVTTPDLGMFRHELLRYISGCHLPSANALLSKCL